MSLRLQRPNERSDTVCDETKKTETAQAHDGRTGSTMPDCCGPMVERMFKAFGEIAESASNRESPQDSSADRVPSCASMMERMASRCCGPTSREEEAKA